MILDSKLYDRLKYVALVVLPAFSALYFGLGEIWNLPKVTEVVGTVAVLDTVLGMFLRQSNLKYQNSDERFDGKIEVEERGEGTMATLALDGDPEEALRKEELTFKVDQGGHTDIPLDEAVPAPKKKAAPRKRAPKKSVE